MSDIVSSGLVLHLDAGNAASYPGSGATWYDLSGNGKDATLYNSPAYSSNNGGTLNFSRSSLQYAQGPAVGSLSSFTTTCWINFNTIFVATGRYPTVMTDLYAEPQGINWITLFYDQENHFRGGFYSSGEHYTPLGAQYYPSAGVWYNFAVSFDDSSKALKFYVNGSVFSSVTLASNVTAQSPGLGYRIGALFGNINPDGYDLIDAKIPKAAVYNRALSDSEILGNYNAIVPRYA